MKKRDLEKLGLHGDQVQKTATVIATQAKNLGIKKAQLKSDLQSVASDPASYLNHEVYGQLAAEIEQYNQAPEGKHPARSDYELSDVKFKVWGSELVDNHTLEQMEHACLLPVSRYGALMPDAHVGYGLPIGGVLAVKDAVIPYAVGVDIACRVMISVFDYPIKELHRNRQPLERILERNTRFGIGSYWEKERDHSVMDQDWSFSGRVANLKDLAWRQLGTSGSGNHFVEFGELHLQEEFRGVPKGSYTALVSHSGSRGPGAKIANHYSRLAQSLHPRLPKKLKNLAWLDLAGEGAEYWQAMELMGEYASANHHIIHQSIAKELSQSVLLQVENHHNFAWKESHFGEEVVVHRKGATPAAKGMPGYIPGTMSNPGFLVEGRGNAEALNSCAHGAGRQMSRKQARNTVTRHEMIKRLESKGVTLLSAGLDESPHAYKDIEVVMLAQSDLVNVIARFDPRIVKMAPEGEKAED